VGGREPVDAVGESERVGAVGESEPAHLVGEPVGLLVLGDGASMHAAPGAGRVDERAGPFDAAVRDALASADTRALLGLDERLAAELGVTGRPGWQVLASVAERAGTPWRAELLYSAAPYGVAYHVAVWRPSL
jgi:aromatic ring-opening dioxygenase LigB subunit